MTISISVKNIKITDNLITIGSSSNGSIAVPYTYTSNMTLGGDAIINGNTFNGCFGNGIGSTNLISITDGYSIVTNNNFIRGLGSPVNAYINITGTATINDQIIKDNSFDQTTTDGTSDILILGLSTGSIYYSNKNQTIYIPIQLGMGTITDPSNGLIYSNAISNALNVITYFQADIFATTLPQMLTININLNEALPDGVRILEMKVGIFANNSTAVISSTPSDNQLFVRMSAVDNIGASYTAGSGSILDAKAAWTAGVPAFKVDTTYDIHGNFTAMLASTQYATISTSNDEKFRNTKDRMLTLTWVHNMKLTTAGSGVAFYFSPILAKCIW